MASQKRNLLILMALLCAWGLIFAFRPPWGSQVGPGARATPTTSPRKPAAQDGGFPRLNRDLLNLAPPAYSPEVQNIFGTPPPPSVPPRSDQATAATPPAPAAPPPPDPFQEEAKRLRYVGYLEAGQRTMAFITQGPEVYTVEVGAMISDRFRVQAITEDAVLVSSATGDKQARLPLAPDAAAAPKR